MHLVRLGWDNSRKVELRAAGGVGTVRDVGLVRGVEALPPLRPAVGPGQLGAEGHGEIEQGDGHQGHVVRHYRCVGY